MRLSGGQVPHCNRDRRPPDVTTSCLTPDPWFENGIDPWSSAKRENPGAGTKAIEKRVRYSDHADALRADTVVGDNVVLAGKTLDAGTHDALSEFLVIQEKIYHLEANMSDPLIPVEPVLEVVSRLDADVQTVNDIIKSMIGEHDILDERIQSLLDRSSRLKVTISAMGENSNGGEVLSSIAFIMRARCDEVIIERDAITSTIQSRSLECGDRSYRITRKRFRARRKNASQIEMQGLCCSWYKISTFRVSQNAHLHL